MEKGFRGLGPDTAAKAEVQSRTQAGTTLSSTSNHVHEKSKRLSSLSLAPFSGPAAALLSPD